VRFFDAPVFIVLWAGLLLATLLCTLHRWRIVWRYVGQPPIRCPDAILHSAPCAALVHALPGSQPTRVLQEALEQRGFRVRVETADSASYLRADRYRLAQLATLVTHLAVFPLLAGVLLNTQLAWRTELTLPPGQAVEVGHGSGMRVSNEGFAVVRYPDGNIASYEADVRVQAVHARIRVNEPFVLEGVGFYLRGYQSRANETVLTLLAAYEPGYGPVIAAGFLFLCGMTVTFAFPACRVQARLGADGTLHLAGWPQRQAVGFEREFAAWVAAVSGGAAEAAGEPRS
jgi:cytochrome c biogenesis protein ResB